MLRLSYIWTSDGQSKKAYFRIKYCNKMQNLCCRNVQNVKFPKIVAEKFAFYIRYDERKDSNSIIHELKSQLLNNNNYWALLKNTIQKKFPNSKKEDDDAIKLKMSIIEDPIKDPAAKRCFRCYYSDDSSNTILLAKHYDFEILESCIIEKGFKIVYKYDSQDCGRCGYLFKLNNKKMK